MQLRDIVASQPALQRLNQRDDMAATLSYAVSVATRAVKDPLESYEKVKNELVQKHGETKKDGSTEIKPGSKHWDKFLDEIEKVLDQEVEVKVKQVKLSDMKFSKDKEGNEKSLSPADFTALSWLITE
jgi:hypothetical protein